MRRVRGALQGNLVQWGPLGRKVCLVVKDHQAKKEKRAYLEQKEREDKKGLKDLQVLLENMDFRV